MTFRARTKDERITEEGSLFYTIWRYSSQTTGRWIQCEDYVGNFEQVNPFKCTTWTKITPCLNGQYFSDLSGKLLRDFVNYPMAYTTTAIPDPTAGFPSQTTATREGWAWEILARTNPSRPYINLPQQIGELRDLPAIVKGWGADMLEEAAKLHITWQFALRPMLSELGKLFEFRKKVNNRIGELMALRGHKVLRKRCQLSSEQTSSAPYRVRLHSEGTSVYAWRTNVFRRKLWGTAQYRTEPGSYLEKMLDPTSTLAKSVDLRDKVSDMLLGCTTRGAAQAAWELVPWSWLADWFGNCGTMLAATNNSVGVTWQKLALMCTSESEVQFEVRDGDKPSWIYFSGEGKFNWKCVRKERWPVAPIIPFPTLTLPALTGGQLSILGSLAILKSGYITRWYRLGPKVV